MRKTITAISGIIVAISLFILLLYAVSPQSFPGYHIEQEVRSSRCVNMGSSLATYVWHNGDIIWSTYDPIETLKDSTKYFRRQEAKEIVRKLKH